MLCPSLVSVQLRAGMALPGPVGDMPHPPNTTSARRPVTKTAIPLRRRIPCVIRRIAHLLALWYVTTRLSERTLRAVRRFPLCRYCTIARMDADLAEARQGHGRRDRHHHTPGIRTF